MPTTPVRTGGCANDGGVVLDLPNRPVACRSRGRRIEPFTTGYDPLLRLVGGDPYRGNQATGLIVPSLPTPVSAAGLDQRYLFLLAYTEIGPDECKRLRGLRQMWTLVSSNVGAADAPRFVSFSSASSVSTPDFRLPDGNISWHLRVQNLYEFRTLKVGPTVKPNMAFRAAKGPSLLYETVTLDAGGNVTAYTPPKRGRPPGKDLIPSLGNFWDVRFPWNLEAWDSSLDVYVQGPCAVGFYASVRQSAGTVSPFALASVGLPAEENFIAAVAPAAGAGSVKIGKVAGAMVWEDVT
jgi:hypothetical protein